MAELAFVEYREPVLETVKRTFTIAAVIGALSAIGGGLAFGLGTFLIVLWFSFGGHWLELGFLKTRHLLPRSPAVQATARLTYWFGCGAILWFPMRATAMALGRTFAAPRWSFGIAFIVAELLAHLFLLQLRGRPSFYNGRG